MSGILAIGETERDHIAIALAAARKRPVPWELLKTAAVDDRAKPTSTLTLAVKDLQDGASRRVRQDYPPQRVQLGTYDCAISFEEQPAGLFKHLSVASRAVGKLPIPPVMELVCIAFGFDEVLCRALGHKRPWSVELRRPARIWIEEFEPGHHAINIIELEP